MSYYSIQPDNINIQVGKMGQYVTKLKLYSREIKEVRDSLDSSFSELIPSLDGLANNTYDHAISVQTLGVSLGAIVQLYRDCESGIVTQLHRPNNPTIIPVSIRNNDGSNNASQRTKSVYDEWDSISSDDPRKKVWEYLPKELKGLIFPVDIMVTDDGFFLFKCSLTELLQRAGADEATKEMFKDYDDWYIMGLQNEDGTVTYSMFKYREISDEKGRNGTAVPFMSLDMNTFASFFGEGKNKATAEQFKNAVDKLVMSGQHQTEYDRKILDYFRNPKSDGSYLMADFIVEKAAEQLPFDSNNKYKLPYEFGELDPYSQDTLKKLAKYGAYDKKTNSIIINRSDGLSEAEKNALLLVTTGDPDKYAFAGENQFHADMYNPKKADDGKTTSGNGSAIASNAGVGEDKKEIFYRKIFKSRDGVVYREQFDAHRED